MIYLMIWLMIGLLCAIMVYKVGEQNITGGELGWIFVISILWPIAFFGLIGELIKDVVIFRFEKVKDEDDWDEEEGSY